MAGAVQVAGVLRRPGRQAGHDRLQAGASARAAPATPDGTAPAGDGRRRRPSRPARRGACPNTSVRRAVDVHGAGEADVHRARAGGGAGAGGVRRRPDQRAGRGTTTGTYGEARSGHSHAGKDIAAPSGTTVRAAQCGTVTQAGAVSGGYGNLVCIQHAGGVTTCYAHLNSVATSKGSFVHVGDVIGTVGCTGSCTGPHLHFEVRENNKPVNPDTYLSGSKSIPARGHPGHDHDDRLDVGQRPAVGRRRPRPRPRRPPPPRPPPRSSSRSRRPQRPPPRSSRPRRSRARPRRCSGHRPAAAARRSGRRRNRDGPAASAPAPAPAAPAASAPLRRPPRRPRPRLRQPRALPLRPPPRPRRLRPRPLPAPATPAATAPAPAPAAPAPVAPLRLRPPPRRLPPRPLRPRPRPPRPAEAPAATAPAPAPAAPAPAAEAPAPAAEAPAAPPRRPLPRRSARPGS